MSRDLQHFSNPLNLPKNGQRAVPAVWLRHHEPTAVGTMACPAIEPVLAPVLCVSFGKVRFGLSELWIVFELMRLADEATPKILPDEGSVAHGRITPPAATGRFND